MDKSDIKYWCPHWRFFWWRQSPTEICSRWEPSNTYLSFPRFENGEIIGGTVPAYCAECGVKQP